MLAHCPRFAETFKRWPNVGPTATFRPQIYQPLYNVGPTATIVTIIQRWPNGALLAGYVFNCPVRHFAIVDNPKDRLFWWPPEKNRTRKYDTGSTVIRNTQGMPNPANSRKVCKLCFMHDDSAGSLVLRTSRQCMIITLCLCVVVRWCLLIYFHNSTCRRG